MVNGEEIRSCVVCGASYQRQTRESLRLWRKRATCGRACATVFRKQPLGTYPTPLLTCRECGRMARPQRIDDGVCADCGGGFDGPGVLDYAASPEGRAFIAHCRGVHLSVVEV